MLKGLNHTSLYGHISRLLYLLGFKMKLEHAKFYDAAHQREGDNTLKHCSPP